jgi:hypothetical protein
MEEIKHLEDFRRKVITEINLCRTNPQGYITKLKKYQNYFKGNLLSPPDVTPQLTSEGPNAYEEAIKVLEVLEPLRPVRFSIGLTNISHDSINFIQKSDEYEKLSELVDKQIKDNGQVIGHYSQAIEFGSSIPELIVINLLVDDGNYQRKNRQNLLSVNYRMVGVTSGAHNVYQNCTVIVLAQHFFDNHENFEFNESNKSFEQRRKSISEYSHITKSKDLTAKEFEKSFVRAVITDDFDLPEGVIRMERFEKYVNEKGVKKKVVKLVKYLDDGTTATDLFKE